jgi:hypothetical protein
VKLWLLILVLAVSCFGQAQNPSAPAKQPTVTQQIQKLDSDHHAKMKAMRDACKGSRPTSHCGIVGQHDEVLTYRQARQALEAKLPKGSQ